MKIKESIKSKLKNRQTIILAVMMAVIMYGLYDHFIASPTKKTGDVAVKTTDLNTFITDVQQGVSQGAPNMLETYMISRAEAEWAKDPFREGKGYREWLASKQPVLEGSASGSSAAASAAAEKAKFVYSGYLETATKKVAIINGFEYRSGASLEEKGYVLKAIYPLKVVIANTENKTELTIPLQD